MRIYNRYILIIALVLLLTTLILIATGQTSLSTYYVVYILEALVITELYIHFNAKARRGLSSVSAILFGGFLFVVCLEFVHILA